MSMSKWRAVTSVILWESVLGLVLFDIFAGDTDSGIECTLSKFAGNTKLCGTVNTLGGKDDKLERWGCGNLMESSTKPRAASSPGDMELEQVQRTVMKMIEDWSISFMVPG